MNCICGDKFQIDFDFKTNYHIAHCLKCNKKIINKSYFQLLQNLKEIDIQYDMNWYGQIAKVRKNLEIRQSYEELTFNTARYDDELSADFLEWAFS